MTLDFNNNDRKTITVAITNCDIDLTAALGWLVVDGTRYAVTWSGPAGSSGGKWSRAGTSPPFAGPAVQTADVNGAAVLAYGSHTVEVTVQAGGTIVSKDCPAFAVRL